MVMSHAPGLQALLNMAAAFPDVASELESRGDEPVPLFMSRSSSPELHRLANAVSTLHSEVSANDPDLDFDNPREDLFSLQFHWCDDVIHELGYITDVKRAIDSFVCEFLALKCHS